MRHIFLVILALTFSTAGIAEDLLPESGACRESRKTYEALRQELKGFSQRTTQIEALLEGSAPPAVTTDDLKRLLGGDDGETQPTEWPQSVRCESVQDNYRKAREALVWQKSQLARLRNTYWTSLPSPAHEAMVNIWQSRARLIRSAQNLAEAGINASAKELAPIAALDSRLQQLRIAFLQLLPNLGPDMSSREVGKWLQQWRNSLDLAGHDFSVPEALLDALGDTSSVTAVEAHYRMAEHDALVLARAFNSVRGWLWQRQRAAFERALGSSEDESLLLYDESRALVDVLRWTAHDALGGSDNTGGTVLRQFFVGVEYLVGLAGFALLALLARATRKPAASLQARFARNYQGNRSKAQLVRFTAGLPVILPWVVGWFGLALLEHLLRSNHLSLLLPLVPFARLYVVYGVLCITGEWFLLRIAALAGSYLSDQQAEAMSRRAKRFARIVILPWLLMDLVGLSLGPSLSLLILDWLTLVAVLIALGLLLKPWRNEFIKALQSFLPETVDRWIERIFQGWRFVLLAPLAAPFMLIALALFFLHKGLVDFDWYRKLMARSFKLRSGQGEEESGLQSDEQALADYQRWFEATASDGKEFPFISVGTAERMQKALRSWLDEKSEENSMLFSGERGSGKTTLLRKTRDWLASQDESVDFPYLEVPAKCYTPADIAALLEPVLGASLVDGPAELVKGDGERRPTVLVLDNAQNFFLRKVGGLEGWEYLLGLTRARLSNLYWIVVINNQSWAYLGNVFGREYQFSSQLYTRRWSQNDIRALILSRNQLSGYRIHYDSILLSSRGPEAGNIRNAEQLYFSLLWDACYGNPLLALRLWLSSVTVNGQQVTVGLPAEVSAAQLERLSKEMHFVYAALVLHENMTSEELVAATALPESRVRAALKTAFNIGLVQRSAHRRYRIVPLWYPVVTRLLARKNLLHE